MTVFRVAGGEGQDRLFSAWIGVQKLQKSTFLFLRQYSICPNRLARMGRYHKGTIVDKIARNQGFAFFMTREDF